MESRPDYWRNDLLYRGSNTERHPGPKRALLLGGRDILLRDVLPTAAVRFDVAVPKLEK